MEIEAIRLAVTTALALKPPIFAPGTAPAVKVRTLEDYLLQSAYVAADLEEALHYLDLLVDHFKDKVAQISGFEVALPRKRAERITREDVLLAKRTVDPTTFEAGAECRQLRATVVRQIDRLKFESGVVSRAYTLISGG
jgi:hypothetical protein